MYYADGIDLTQTEFDELKFVVSCGGGCSGKVRARTESDASPAPAYRSLVEKNLITCQMAWGGAVLDCQPTRKAPDWLKSYEKGERDRRRMLRRDWVMLGVSAVVSGIVSLAVSLIVTHL